jgi:hypothetical protein
MRAMARSGYDEPVAVFHQQMAHKAQPALLAIALAIEPGIGIGRALMGLVRTLLLGESCARRCGRRPATSASKSRSRLFVNTVASQTASSIEAPANTLVAHHKSTGAPATGRQPRVTPGRRVSCDRDAQIRYIDRRRRAPAHLFSRGEGLRHIGDEIVGMLDADRCSDQGWRDPDLAARLFRQTGMHRRRWMANQ